MNYQLVVDTTARKQIKKFPKKDAEHIVVIMTTMQQDPYSGDTTKLQGRGNTWRRRIGSYRIFYEIYADQSIIYVFNIKRRTSKTY